MESASRQFLVCAYKSGAFGGLVGPGDQIQAVSRSPRRPCPLRGSPRRLISTEQAVSTATGGQMGQLRAANRPRGRPARQMREACNHKQESRQHRSDVHREMKTGNENGKPANIISHTLRKPGRQSRHEKTPEPKPARGSRHRTAKI